MLESIKNEPTRLAAVLPLGDVQYECGEIQNFDAFYTPSWGRTELKAKNRPVIGNHEYRVPEAGNSCLAHPGGLSEAGARGTFEYFGSLLASPQDTPGCTTSPDCKGYYSYNLGTWHLVALNSNCTHVVASGSGCGSSSPQANWLRADLQAAASTSNCILAYWHHPRYSSGGRQTGGVQALWEILFDRGADVVLTGHDHSYERFAKLGRGTSAAADPVADPNGIREWVVGTGGRNFTSFTTIRTESEVRDRSAMGVLKMVLHANGYDFEFLKEAGSSSTFTDKSLSPVPCNGVPPVGGGGDTTPPTVSTRSPAAGATWCDEQRRGDVQRTGCKRERQHVHADRPGRHGGAGRGLRLGQPVHPESERRSGSRHGIHGDAHGRTVGHHRPSDAPESARDDELDFRAG